MSLKLTELPITTESNDDDLIYIVKDGISYGIKTKDIVTDEGELANNKADAYRHESRVSIDGGITENIEDLIPKYSLFKNASLAMLPHSYKAGKLYNQFPVQPYVSDYVVLRNSTKTRFNEFGEVETLPINTPSIDYYTGVGLLTIEDQSTNLYINSQTMVTQDVTTIADEYTVSFLGNGSINFSGSYVGTLVGVDDNTLVQITFTASAGTLTSTVSGTVSYGQCEIGDYPSSRIITGGTPVTRIKDQITGVENTRLFNESEGVLILKTQALTNEGSFDRRLSISDGTNSGNVVEFRFSSTNSIGCLLYSNSTLYGSVNHSLDITELNTYALVYKINRFELYVNGVLEGQDTNVANMPINLDRLSFSRGGGSQSIFYSKTEKVCVYDSIQSAINDGYDYITP